MLSSGTGRIEPAKLEIHCSCGKRYRVPATKAGKRVRCKRCRAKIQVPGDGAISMRTRRAILEDLGIDAEAAERRYEAEREESRQAEDRQGYVCGGCQETIDEEALKESYTSDGLRCDDCRAALVEQRELGDPSEKAKKKKKQKLDTWATGTTPEQAAKKAKAMGLLFFVGLTGMAWSFGASLWLAVPIGAAVAYVGGRAVFNSEYTPPIDADEDDD
jgi:DNA-directed RNA polymerase subunit RPC12/RpoP